VSASAHWVRKGFGALADQGLISGTSFAVSVLLARLVGPEEYGAYVLGLSVLLFAASFHNALVIEPLSVFGPSSYRDRFRGYLGTVLRLHVVLTGALALLIAGGAAVVWGVAGPGALAPALLGAAVATPLLLLFWTGRRAAYAVLRPRLAFTGAVAFAAVMLGGFALLYSAEALTGLRVLALTAAAGLVAAVPVLLAQRPALGPAAEGLRLGEVARVHWEYGRWVVATSIPFWLAGDAYQILVGAVLSIPDVAALRALQNLAVPMTQVMTAIGLLVLPWASAALHDQGPAAMHWGIVRVTLLLAAAAVVYGALLWLFGRPATVLLYKGRYAEHAHLLPLLAAGLPLAAVAQGFVVALQAMRAPDDVFKAYLAAGIFSVVGGLALTRALGLAGALAGYSLSFLVVAAAALWLYRRRARSTAAGV
jgi:O-antigen/teichoic acid export membrane protein